MSRPARIPERGDVAESVVATRLGLSLPDFRAHLPALLSRGFPEADETTGRYCLEAVDRWRLRRCTRLFPELTATAPAAHADTVFAERLRRIGG
jgi:hypothetical protein